MIVGETWPLLARRPVVQGNYRRARGRREDRCCRRGSDQTSVCQSGLNEKRIHCGTLRSVAAVYLEARGCQDAAHRLFSRAVVRRDVRQPYWSVLLRNIMYWFVNPHHAHCIERVASCGKVEALASKPKE